jgi:hypothetical protein
MKLGRIPCGALLASVAMFTAASAHAGSNPLLGNHNQAVAVPDSDLAKVKGSGYYSYVYGFYGALFSEYALVFGDQAQFYNFTQGTGSTSPTTTFYQSAYNYASSAANYYSTALNYAKSGQ